MRVSLITLITTRACIQGTYLVPAHTELKNLKTFPRLSQRHLSDIHIVDSTDYHCVNLCQAEVC